MTNDNEATWDYRAMWDALTDGERAKLTAATHGETMFYIPPGMRALIQEGAGITDLGHAVYEAGNTPRIAEDATPAPDALAIANARVRELEAALREIIERAPKERPVEDSDYAWDDLKEGREMGIASAHYSHGDDMARWYTAEFARKALDGAGEGGE